MSIENELDTVLRAADREAGNDEGLEEIFAQGRRRVAKALKRVRRPLVLAGVIMSPVGKLFVAISPRGILSVHFMDTKTPDPIPMMREQFDVVENQPAADRIGDQIRRYIMGDRKALSRKIDLSMVRGDFQRRALTKLCSVPIGSVMTYQALATAVGAPDGQRAVGNTMASNPIPIYVPCHRVIRSDGTIGNYGGGVDRKLKLLRAEGFAVGKDLRVPKHAVMGHQRTHIYCKPECPAARRADPGRCFIFADPEHARRAGLRACKVCRPA
jgi:O-6-methylguanine DNA methyltransferase